MPYTIDYVPDGAYVVVTMFDETLADEIERSQDAAAAALTANHASKLLIDASQSYKGTSTIDSYELMLRLRDHLPGVAMAFVTSPSKIQGHRFLEDVAQNRGVNLRLFLARDEAVSWLVDGVSDYS